MKEVGEGFGVQVVQILGGSENRSKAYLVVRVARIAGANDGAGPHGRRSTVDSFFNGLPERLACDGTFTRVLIDSKSQVIDVGRATRAISAPMRKGLRARDRHCIWPGGCDRPVSWCEPHHIEHWLHGGESNLPNLSSLCNRHHWLVHEGGWILFADEGGLKAMPPPPLEHVTSLSCMLDSYYFPPKQPPEEDYSEKTEALLAKAHLTTVTPF